MVSSFSSGGTSVIDTKGTANWQDDSMALIGDTTSVPIFFAGSATGSSYIDQARNIMYSPTAAGVTALNLNPTYGPNGTLISQPIDIVTQAKTYLKWNQTLNSGNSVNMQIRKGDANAAWIDDFNDGDLTNLTDYYTRNKAFNTKSESGSIASLTNPTSTYAQMALDTGKAANYFPAGSRISIRTRYVGSSATDVGFRIYSDNYEANTMNVGYISSEWRTITLQPTAAFNIVELYNFWSGSWNNATDRIDIDWIKIELPDAYWGSWESACSDNTYCTTGDTTGMNWLQYKVNLATTDTSTTPLVNSVSLSDGYNTSGTFESSILENYGQTWQTFSANETLPTDTSIQYYTRTGSSLSPDSSWTGWTSITNGGSIPSSNNRYLQYKAVLSTSNVSRSPSISAVTVQYRDTVAPYGSIGLMGGGNITRTFDTDFALLAYDDQTAVTEMALSNDEEFSYSSWEPYKIEKTWRIAQYGKRYVYVKYKDSDGNESPVYSMRVYYNPYYRGTSTSSSEEISKSNQTEKETINYTIKVKVVDNNNRPIENVKVTLHSDPIEAITDGYGIATFNNVEAGKHTIIVNHNGQTKQEPIELSGDVKNISITIHLDEQNPFSKPPVLIIICILSGLLITSIFIIRKSRKV